MRFDRLTRVWLAALTGACGALFLLAVPPSEPALADAITDLERGSQARREGNYRAALLLFTRAIKSSELDDESLAVAYNNRCAVFNSLLRLDRALGDCTRAVQLQPKFAKAYINRGLSLGRYVPAIADYSKAVSLEPKLIPGYSNRAYAKFRLAAFESASSDYEAAIELAPRVSVLHGGLPRHCTLCSWSASMKQPGISAMPTVSIALHCIGRCGTISQPTASAMKTPLC